MHRYVEKLGFVAIQPSVEAFKTISLVIRDCIDQPTTFRENRSNTTARYKPAFMCADMSDISHPRRIWRTRIKLPLQPVRDYNMGLPASMPWASITNLCPKPRCAHQSVDPRLTAVLAVFAQVAEYLPVAIHSPTLQPELLDQACEPLISKSAFGLRPL